MVRRTKKTAFVPTVIFTTTLAVTAVIPSVAVVSCGGKSDAPPEPSGLGGGGDVAATCFSNPQFCEDHQQPSGDVAATCFSHPELCQDQFAVADVGFGGDVADVGFRGDGGDAAPEAAPEADSGDGGDA